MTLAALRKLHGNGRIRKSAILLERLERACDTEDELADAEGSARDIALFLRSEIESPPEVLEAAGRFLDSASRETPLRRLNDFRHALMKSSGQAPADWDFIGHEKGEPERRPIPGMRVYLEDIRSPFNVGTILRTAEAFGFEEALLSPGCADPRHPRALRSAMGAVDMIPWRRIADVGLPELAPLIALELGGEDIREFDFPSKGTLVLGSEELGVSASTLSLPGLSRISIPMRGKKASINVAVAFGIAAQAWSGVFR
jgi:TrmH family RNA methyltransferase